MNPPITPDPTASPGSINPWPVALGLFFATLLTTIAGFTVFALRLNTDLVRRDYYEQELRHEGQMAREQRTRALTEGVRIDCLDGAVRLKLPFDHARQGVTGNLQFYRPSNASLDHEVPLAPDASGRQWVDTRHLKPGLWRVRAAWTSGGDDYYHESALIFAPPAP